MQTARTCVYSYTIRKLSIAQAAATQDDLGWVDGNLGHRLATRGFAQHEVACELVQPAPEQLRAAWHDSSVLRASAAQ